MQGFVKPFRDPLWKRILGGIRRRKRIRSRNRCPIKPRVKIYYCGGRRYDE